jgi:hypothetical protein
MSDHGAADTAGSHIQVVAYVFVILFYGGALFDKLGYPSIQFWMFRVALVAGAAFVAASLPGAVFRSRPMYRLLIVAVLGGGANFFFWNLPRSRVSTWETGSMTVSATAAQADPVNPDSLIRVPPGQGIEFLGAATSEWTHDPHDGIRVLLQNIPIGFPFGAPTSNGTIRDFRYVKELSRLDSTVAANHPAEAGKYRFQDYVDRFDSTRLSRGKTLPIVVGPISKSEIAPLEFWTHAIADYLCPDRGHCPQDARRPFGPYYDAEGRKEEGAQGAEGTVPCPHANMGQVCALQVKVESGQWVRTDRRWSFAHYGDEILNDAARDTIYVRLLMNDDAPADNSPWGYAIIRYRIFSLGARH